MTPLEQEIVDLSKIWYNFVSVDHHKDRDCHWYVEQYFSYSLYLILGITKLTFDTPKLFGPTNRLFV